MKKSADIPSDEKLAQCLLSYRSSPHITTGVTRADLFVKRRLKTRQNLLKPDLRKFVSCNPGKYFQEGTPYEIGDTVIVWDHRVSSDVKLIKGGICIIQKVSDVTYIVQTCSEGIHWKCHRDQIQHSLELDKYVPRSTNQQTEMPGSIPWEALRNIEDELVRAPMVKVGNGGDMLVDMLVNILPALVLPGKKSLCNMYQLTVSNQRNKL